MGTDEWAHGMDIEAPSSARMYDYYLGGSHNFTADREAAAKVIAAMPSAPRIARANRAFLHRSVRYMLAHGIRQFLDLGSGIPTVGNVHEVAHRVAPESRVVYVDIDPVAITLAGRLLDGDERAVAIRADLRRPQEVLQRPELLGVLDLTRPVGVLLVSVLHFVSDADDPHGVVASLRDSVVPGSYLALSHGLDTGFASEQAAAVQGVYRSTPTPGGLRTSEQIAAFFDGFELVEPGIVWLDQWRPDQETAGGQPAETGIVAGVGLRR
jgi:S-adenosyl methyltransferase